MVTPVTVSPKVCTSKTPTPPTKYPNKVMFPTNRRIDNIFSILNQCFTSDGNVSIYRQNN